MTKSFEKFLEEDCCPYEVVLDDYYEDHFEGWLENLDGDQYILYADKYAQLRADYAYTEGVKKGMKVSTQVYNDALKIIN